MKWNLINPSDPYTMEADTLAAAALAVVLLGNGMYALEPIDAPEGVPIFAFGALDAFDRWWDERSDVKPKEWLDAHRAEVAAALRTVTIPDECRSSLNNIGARAAALAERLEEAAR